MVLHLLAVQQVHHALDTAASNKMLTAWASKARAAFDAAVHQHNPQTIAGVLDLAKKSFDASLPRRQKGNGKTGCFRQKTGLFMF